MWLPVERSAELPSWHACPGDRPAFVGADLRPPTIAAAFRAGFFPWPPADESWEKWHERTWGEDLRNGRIHRIGPDGGFTLTWWAPDPRGMLVPSRARIPKSQARFARHSEWTTTTDQATATVIQRCGPQRGQDSWLSAELASAYVALAEAGDVHSTEVWAGNDLAAGVFGVLVGGVLSIESAFASRSNGGTIAMLDLVVRFRDAGGELIDLHMVSPHWASLGAEELPRDRFQEILEGARDRRLVLPDDRRAVSNLAEVLPTRAPAGGRS